MQIINDILKIGNDITTANIMRKYLQIEMLLCKTKYKQEVAFRQFPVYRNDEFKQENMFFKIQNMITIMVLSIIKLKT